MLKRTRANAAFAIRAWMFDRFGFQKMLDRREMNELEDHMGFRGQIPEHRRFQIDFLKSQGLKPQNTLLEIGCGPMTAGLPLIEYLEPDNYVGVDVRPEVLHLSWQQIGKAGLSAKNPRLITSSTFGDESLGDLVFDYILTFSVLFHLSDEILDRWFAMVAKRGGVAYANVNTTMDSSTWLQFPFLKRTVDTYQNMAAKHGLKTENLGTMEALGFKLPFDDRLGALLRLTPA